MLVRTAQHTYPDRDHAKASNAIDLLKADHREVEGLFAKFVAAKADSSKQTIAIDVCKALTVHTRIEDELFYPACRARGVDEALMNEADVEHASVKDLVAQIESQEPSEPHWEALVTVLAEQVEHHVKEEEGPKGIFAKARKAGLDLAALGAELAARKDELMA